MQSLIRSKSAGVTGGRGTAGAGPGRDPNPNPNPHEVTEGGFSGQLGPPGERSTAPTARARRKGARRRNGESQKGVP